MIPSSQALLRPLLEASAAQSGPTDIATLRAPLVAQMNLTPEECQQKLNSGVLTYVNRIAWAKSFLVRAGLLTAGRSVWITEAGRALLDKHVGPITRKQLEALPTWTDKLSEKSSAATAAEFVELSPEEQLDLPVEELSNATKAELLARIHAEPRAFFERFIRDLMLAMGYGGGIRDRGFLTGRTGDGGVDGLIHEDSLGLDAVYLQAKRYQPGSNISAEQIRGFVCAMTGENATKGVFVTTSAFTRDAIAFVERVTQRIVLIDGERLADLALRHGVGVRTQRSIAIQRIDEDYFAGED